MEGKIALEEHFSTELNNQDWNAKGEEGRHGCDYPQDTTNERFEIFEQLHLHQRCLDNDASRESARKQVDFYWPEDTFTVRGIRTKTFGSATASEVFGTNLGR